MTPRPEAVTAAAWWAEQLATPLQHDIGAPLSTAFANVTTDRGRRQRTPEQIDSFRAALAREIEQRLDRWLECWQTEDPQLGAGFRIVRTDYGPDPVLRRAAERAEFRLTSLDLPMKTVMWIDPGVVKVAQGHGASITRHALRVTVSVVALSPTSVGALRAASPVPSSGEAGHVPQTGPSPHGHQRGTSGVGDMAVA